MDKKRTRAARTGANGLPRSSRSMLVVAAWELVVELATEDAAEAAEGGRGDASLSEAALQFEQCEEGIAGSCPAVANVQHYILSHRMPNTRLTFPCCQMVYDTPSPS